ncbi:MAG TPA: type II toxin-antitoxin system RelE/ParE family toxin [Chitinophagales bacterium]|nr:type II toxin-antitoxin system RelE/ParE family toxin [Chitinophagales bacterium]
MVRIKWLKSAKDDLKEIYDYVAFDSKRYARLQVEKIRDKTEILRTQIKAGKINEEINQESVREIIEGNYRIIYRIIAKDEVHILMVHHGARDLTRRTKGL